MVAAVVTPHTSTTIGQASETAMPGPLTRNSRHEKLDLSVAASVPEDSIQPWSTVDSKTLTVDGH